MLARRLSEVEDAYQAQAANQWAYRLLAEKLTAELKQINSPDALALIDPVAQRALLEAAWDDFMQTKTVKKGIPARPMAPSPTPAQR